VPPGYASFIPSAIREAVSLPVVGVGRFKDPLQAERALSEGQCDLVGIVRGQIADPELVGKARAGRTEAIRLCLSCNQECVGRMGLNRWLGCIENPATGRESVLRHGSGAGSAGAGRPLVAGAWHGVAQPPVVGVAPGDARLLVVGAGPAGLQAAIAGARAGKVVTVVERSSEAGGHVRLAASVPNRAEFGDLVRNQLHECRELGVEIRFGEEASIESALASGARTVVVATGSRPRRPHWADVAVAEGIAVADVTEVLDGSAAPESNVLVIDEVGFHQATSIAELLADRGCSVEIMTPGMVVGQDLGITLDLEGFNMRAAAKAITQSTDRVVMGAADGSLQVLHHPTGTMETRAVTWVVLALPPEPEDGLYLALRDARPALDVRRAGDCVAPRRAHSAVIEGDLVGARP
jgi:2,4-dienoyl-CoA reductase (NADPH2)